MTAEATDASPAAAPANFYAQAAKDAAKLIAASQVQGFDDELATLRVKLNEHITKFPGDLELLIKGARLIAQMVASRYRMSPARTDELEGAFATFAERMTQQLFPEQFDDV